MTDGAPFSTLTPETLLDALFSVGLEPDGRLLALNSYENRVWLAYQDAAPALVLKFYRPNRWSDEQILEEHAFSLELASQEVPVVAPLVLRSQTLHRWGEHRFAVFPKWGGRAPELDAPNVLPRIGRFLGRIHAVGRQSAFLERPTFDIERMGREPSAYLLSQGMIPESLKKPLSVVHALALEGVAQAYAEVGDVRPIRLHGDCHASNILWTDDGPHFVDLDDSRMGPAVQDFWMLWSGDRQAQQQQLADLLDGYEQFSAFDPRELRLVEALRTLRIIHYAGWLSRRWMDPAFPVAFPWFGDQRYWESHVLTLREQVAMMSEPPLVF